jgi:DNA-binding MarR family transcriptional regulator
MDPNELIDETVSSWGEQRPDLDFEAMGVALGINVVTAQYSEIYGDLIKSLGITLGEFDVLATLRRNGKRGVLTPKEIARVAMISPSGLTNRLTRLENMGHIDRQMDPTDRRSSLVRLTAKGAKTADVAIERLSAEMNAVFHGLNKRDLEAFTRVIEALLGRVESKISKDSL